MEKIESIFQLKTTEQIIEIMNTLTEEDIAASYDKWEGRNIFCDLLFHNEKEVQKLAFEMMKKFKLPFELGEDISVERLENLLEAI